MRPPPRAPDPVQSLLAGMDAPARAAFLRLNPALAALDTQRRAAVGGIAGDVPARVAADASARELHAAQGAAAQEKGATFERDVFGALDALLLTGRLAWWEHTGPGSKRLPGGEIVVTGRALCDVVGCLADGRALVAEVKRGNRRVVLDPAYTGRDAHVAQHQRDQLDATDAAGGLALLVAEVDGQSAVFAWRAEVDGQSAVFAWRAVRDLPALRAGDVRPHAAPPAEGLRRAIGCP